MKSMRPTLPDEKTLFTDWEQAVSGLVAGFRASVGTEINDPRVVELVGELSSSSEEFRRLWARHDVVPLAGGSFRLSHPSVGPMQLRREKLPLQDTGGQILGIYHAEPNSETARSLDLLGSLALTPDTGP